MFGEALNLTDASMSSLPSNSTHTPSAPAAGPSTSNPANPICRSRSVSNARQNVQLDSKELNSERGGGGLESRFDMSGRGMEVLDSLFGRGWSLNPNTGMISVSDASFLGIMNPDPLEKWYILDPEPMARYVLVINFITRYVTNVCTYFCSNSSIFPDFENH